MLLRKEALHKSNVMMFFFFLRIKCHDVIIYILQNAYKLM